jgi:hypothetical protein
MNRYHILLGKRPGLLIQLYPCTEFIYSLFSKWMRKHQYNFSDYKWYRKWYGGKWIRWSTEFGVLWMTEKEKMPGCCLSKIKEEIWKEKLARN